MADRPDLMPLVDICLRRIRAGESVDACLADYPAEAAELRPLLEVALLLRPAPPPAPDAARRAAARARFLSQAAALQAPVPVDIATALDACLLRIRSGESIEGVLADYPLQAATLHPLIEAALTVGTVPSAPAPDPAKRAAYRERFLTLAAALLGAASRVSTNGHVPDTARPTPAPWYRRAYAAVVAFLGTPGYGRRLGIAAAGLVLVLMVATTGVLAVSAESLPGDPLYPVKEVSRSVELALAITPDAREAVLERQETEKQVEIVLLQERPSRPPTIAIPSFSDVITAIDANGVWTVGRVRVRVSPDMLASLGSRVRISGTLGPDGIVDATQVLVLASPPGGTKIAQQLTAEEPPSSGSAAALAAATATSPVASASATSAPAATATQPAERVSPSGKPGSIATATGTALSPAGAPGSIAAAPATPTTVRVLAQPTPIDTSTAPGAAAAPTGEVTPAPPGSAPSQVIERPTQPRRNLELRLANVKLAKRLSKDDGSNQVWLAYRSGDPGQPFYIVLDNGTQVENGTLAEGRTIDLRGDEADVSLLRATLGSLADQVIPSLSNPSAAAQPDVHNGGSQPSMLVVRARRIVVASNAPMERDITGNVVSRAAGSDGQSWQWILSVGGEQVLIIQNATTNVTATIPADVSNMTAHIWYVIQDGVKVATRIDLSPRPTPTSVPVGGQWFEPAARIFVIDNARGEWRVGNDWTLKVTRATVVVMLPPGTNTADLTTPGIEYAPEDAPVNLADIVFARVFGTAEPSNPRVINAQRIRVYPLYRSAPTATNPPPPSPTATNPPLPSPTATEPPPSPTATNPPPPSATATNPPPSPTATNPPPTATDSPPTPQPNATRPSVTKPMGTPTPRP